ncbi:MAG: universal stress protein [Acidimicrobiales bacterium]|nr:universal stress protein [Acidimicrobiales bacterium]
MTEILVATTTNKKLMGPLRWAASFAEATGGALTVAHAIEPVSAELSTDTWNQLARRDHDELVDLLAATTGVPARVETLLGEPHHVLADFAEAKDFDWVVVGHHSAGGTGGFGGTGTALHLIRHTPCRVIAVGESGVLGTGPVLVAVDGSAANADAVAAAATLATDLGVDLVGVFCPDPLADSYPRPAGWSYRDEGAVRAELAGVLGADAELIVRPGHPTESILAMAGEVSAQMVVVGTRGRGGFQGLRVGRVPIQLLDHLTLPLVVVPHGHAG